MSEKIREFTQEEYVRVLDEHNARNQGLTQRECEHILMDHGASYEQAKNGAYVYRHHGRHTIAKRKGSRKEYDRLLDDFECTRKRPIECIRYLESLDFGYRQAQTAVYNYRKRRGLIRQR